jgi:integrase
MGYSKNQMTAHGFRTSASSLLNESGKWNPDAIERALAHMVSGTIRRIYNQSAYWVERVEMAQWWSDYLDGLRDSGNRLPPNAKVTRWNRVESANLFNKFA